MSAVVPSWPAILAVLAAVWLVFGWAIYAHPAQAPGRHRPETAGVPDVFDRVLAGSGGGGVLPVLPFKAPPGFYRLDFDIEPDDWVADLPTEQFPAVGEQPQHTSPTQRARERWGVDCPIFAQLAEDWGYELGGELRAAA